MRQFQSNALCFKLYAIGFDIATIFQEIKNCVFEDKFQEWDTDDLPRRSYTDQYGSYTDLPRLKRMITDKVGLRFQVPASCDPFSKGQDCVFEEHVAKVMTQRFTEKRRGARSEETTSELQ